MSTTPTQNTQRPQPPRGLLRFAFRLPVGLYRLRLGWLLGYRFLLLTHRGRKSGMIRQTMLEVLQYDPAMRESIVFSGMGTYADWFRNIKAHPAIEVRTGRLRYVPTHRVLNRMEAARAMTCFEMEHPWEARFFAPVLKWLGWSVHEAPGGHGLPSDLLLVAFRPDEASRCGRVTVDPING